MHYVNNFSLEKCILVVILFDAFTEMYILIYVSYGMLSKPLFKYGKVVIGKTVAPEQKHYENCIAVSIKLV